MAVSENSGFPPKSSIFIGFSIIFTIHFGGFSPYFWKHPNLGQPRHWAAASEGVERSVRQLPMIKIMAWRLAVRGPVSGGVYQMKDPRGFKKGRVEKNLISIPNVHGFCKRTSRGKKSVHLLMAHRERLLLTGFGWQEDPNMHKEVRL